LPQYVPFRAVQVEGFAAKVAAVVLSLRVCIACCTVHNEMSVERQTDSLLRFLLHGFVPPAGELSKGMGSEMMLRFAL
jgi:hypothetical protein